VHKREFVAEVLIERVPQGKIWDWLLSDKPLALHKSIELVASVHVFAWPPLAQARGKAQSSTSRVCHEWAGLPAHFFCSTVFEDRLTDRFYD